MRQPRKPDPEVLESDYRVPTALGTAAWIAALIALLALGDRLPEEDRWWRWVCVTGIAFGVFAFCYIPRHLRRTGEGQGADPGAAPAEPAPATGTADTAPPAGRLPDTDSPNSAPGSDPGEQEAESAAEHRPKPADSPGPAHKPDSAAPDQRTGPPPAGASGAAAPAPGRTDGRETR
ncbi:hypothetical protein GCM10027570_02750 [Streptomonospora sediminis]